MKKELCYPKDLNCVKNVKVDTSRCMKTCSGLIVTGFSKSNERKTIENVLPLIEPYNQYKKITNYPSGYSGIVSNMLIILFLLTTIIFRLQMEKQPKICKDLL